MICFCAVHEILATISKNQRSLNQSLEDSFSSYQQSLFKILVECIRLYYTNTKVYCSHSESLIS